MAYEEMLFGIIEDDIAGDERTQQKRIGPSGLGTLCYHCLGCMIAEVPKKESVADRWLTFIGRCVHTGLEKALVRRNRKLGFERFLPEHKVFVGNVGDIRVTGTTDFYDTVEHVVGDWKVVGKNTLNKVRRGDVSETYLGQADLYGLGLSMEGLEPEKTCIMFLPRDLFHVREGVAVIRDWDKANALACLKRANDIKALMDLHGTENVIRQLKRKPGCYDCPRYAI
jgi:hypothetical protein